MSKWEYIRIGFAHISSGAKIEPLVFLAPADKVNHQWLTEKFPEIEIRIDERLNGIRLMIPVQQRKSFLGTLPNNDGFQNATQVYYAIMSYLCSSGWEPFTITVTFLGESGNYQGINFNELMHLRRTDK